MAREYKYFYNENLDTLLQVELENGAEIIEITELQCGHTVDIVEEESEEEDTVEDDVEDEKPQRAPSKPRGGRDVSYDREALKEAIRQGDKKPKVLAQEFGVSLPVVYTLKSDMKKDGELNLIDTPSPAPKSPTVGLTNREKVKQMVDNGFDDAYIYDKMHDFMTDAEFREALDDAKGIL